MRTLVLYLQQNEKLYSEQLFQLALPEGHEVEGGLSVSITRYWCATGAPRLAGVEGRRHVEGPTNLSECRKGRNSDRRVHGGLNWTAFQRKCGQSGPRSR